MSRTALTPALIVALLPATAFAGSINATTTGVFDEQTHQLNAIDQQAIGNTITLIDFSNAIAAAYASDSGGVITFDDITEDQWIINADTLNVSYGISASNNLTVSHGDIGDWRVRNRSDNGNGIPVSNSTGLNNESPLANSGLLLTKDTDDKFVFNFSAGLSHVGVVALSRDGTARSVTATAKFDDSSTASSSANLGTTQGTADSFFGFEAPTGRTITSLEIDGSSYFHIDDLAFAVSTYTPVPDPATVPWTRHTIKAGAANRDGADGARLGDFNQDGLTDVIVSYEESSLVAAYVNPGPANVTGAWSETIIGSSPDVEDSFFVDVDGDGRLDVVSSEETGSASNPQGNIRIHFAPTTGDVTNSSNWTDHVAISAAANIEEWIFSNAFQVDGANGIDIIAGGKRSDLSGSGSPGSSIGWLEAPADPRTNPAGFAYHEIDEVGWTMSVINSDMDGDGDLDIVLTDRARSDRSARWLENPSINPDGISLTGSWNSHLIGAAGEEVMFMDLGDLDGDGDEDAVVPTRDGKLFWMERLDASGENWLTHNIAFPVSVGEGKAARIADINGDGQMDIALTFGVADGLSGLVWLEYQNDPTDFNWKRYEISGLDGSKFDLAQLIDLDGDGDLDLITTDEGEFGADTGLGVVWYENPAVPEPACISLLASGVILLLRSNRQNC